MRTPDVRPRRPISFLSLTDTKVIRRIPVLTAWFSTWLKALAIQICSRPSIQRGAIAGRLLRSNKTLTDKTFTEAAVSAMDRVSPEQRSRMMRAIRSKDMSPELAVRRLVHRMGYRYRLHRHSLPGRPDLVSRAAEGYLRAWMLLHQHQNRRCRLVHKPLSNLAYWQPKLERNKTRDAAHRKALKKEGWDVLVVWECEVEEDKSPIAGGFLGPRR